MSSSTQTYINLWLPVPKRQTFTYAIPAKWKEKIAEGRLVLAPLGRRKVVGVVESHQFKKPEGVVRIKTPLEIFPEDYSIKPELLKLFRWAQRHYLAPPGEILRSFLPNAILKGIKGKGEGARHRRPLNHFQMKKMATLNPAQKKAFERVRDHMGTFFPCLLQGITGSGKTEVYLKLCEEILNRGGGVLILVPEIGLTPQILGRFSASFGNEVGSYHSSMTDSQRLNNWWEAKEGRKKILIGTRSAVCLPVKNLSLIIIDEEHDSSYKQEERFRYHGRDLAVMRARIESIPILLGTATPSIESRENVQRAKYHHLVLTERATMGQLPKIHLIDLRKDPPQSETFLSETLQKKLGETLDRGEQALFFLNRRGFAPFVLCPDCGEVCRCPNCEISLTLHKRPPVLKCHYCEYAIPIFKQCPKCEGFNLDGIGSGTERIEEDFKKLYPGVRIGRLDRDVTMSRKRTEEVLSQFETGEIDVLIGTQLVTKGHDFRQLTLVGILMADLTLNLPDFRAAERLFQIVTQVAGRAGRHELPGEVFLQTFRPEHYSITSALTQDPEQFYVQERAFREMVEYPPFTRMILLRFSGNQKIRVEEGSKRCFERLNRLFQKGGDVKILGPAPSTLGKIRGKFRWQILLRTKKFEGMRRVLEENIPRLESEIPAGVQLGIDVDPVGIF